MKALNLPILWCEQMPEKMGGTIHMMANLMLGLHPISKSSFSCWGEERFRTEVQSLQRKQVLLAGIETLFITTNPLYSYLSSSLVKEVATYGGDVSGLIPARVHSALQAKLSAH